MNFYTRQGEYFREDEKYIVTSGGASFQTIYQPRCLRLCLGNSDGISFPRRITNTTSGHRESLISEKFESSLWRVCGNDRNYWLAWNEMPRRRLTGQEESSLYISYFSTEKVITINEVSQRKRGEPGPLLAFLYWKCSIWNCKTPIHYGGTCTRYWPMTFPGIDYYWSRSYWSSIVPGQLYAQTSIFRDSYTDIEIGKDSRGF